MFYFPSGGYLIKMTKAHFTIVRVKQEKRIFRISNDLY